MKEDVANRRKKGLAIIYDPHALMQFVEFFCMNDYDAEWDALCLPSEGGEEQMKGQCEATDLFNYIYAGDTEYRSISIINKAVIFAKAVFLAIIRRRKSLCLIELKKYGIDAHNYDYFVANTDTGFISGMLALLAPEKTVIYFEDGMGEYGAPRNRWKSCLKNPFENIQAVIMARLGYCGKGFTWHEETKNTVKYCTNANEIQYKNFQIIKEFKLNVNARKQYQEIMSKAYPEIRDIYIEKDSAIVFTVPNDRKMSNWADYLSVFFDIVEEEHKRIIIKPHPRDYIDYKEICNQRTSKTTIIDKNIPAELFTHLINDTNTCYFMISETVMLSLYSTGCKVKLLLWRDAVGEDNVEVQYTDLERFLPGRYLVREITAIS